MSKADETRRALIDAAVRILSRDGWDKFSLDAVATEAGVSKGGLLHHFRTKQALLEGTLGHLFDAFRTRVEAHYATELPTPGRWLRAYVRASFEDYLPATGIMEIARLAFESGSALQSLIEADYLHWQTRFAADGIAPARAAVIRLAADSLLIERWIVQDRATHDAILSELLYLASESSQ